MWLLEKTAIIYLAQFLMIQRIYSKPHTFLNNNQAKENNRHMKSYLTSVHATDIKNSKTNSDSVHKAFNFRDTEYPVVSAPRQQFYYQDFDNQSPQSHFMPDASNIKSNSDLKLTKNGTFHNLQKSVKAVKGNVNKSKGVPVPKEFISDSSFRNVGNFPEVEYPLNAKETWKPNYWSIPSEFTDLNGLLGKNSHFTQNLTNIYPKKNFETCSKSGKYRSFPIKSYSDTTKNKELLKQIKEYKARNKQNNSTCRNDINTNYKKEFATDINTLPIEKVQESQTTPIPYYFTPSDISTDHEEFSIDFSNTFNIFNKSNQDKAYSSIIIQNDLIPNIFKTDNQFTNDIVFNVDEKNTIQQNNNDQKENRNIQEMKYDPYDIIDIRKPENILCDLDDDYTTDIYSEDKNIGWFSQPISTPKPFSADDVTWKNCKILTPCEFHVDELEDYYIAV